MTPLGSVVQYSHAVDLRPEINVSNTTVPKMVPNPNFAGFDIYPPDENDQDIFTIEISEGDISRVIEGYNRADLTDTIKRYKLD